MKKEEPQKRGNLPMAIIIYAQKVYSQQQSAPQQNQQPGQTLEMQPGWGGKGR